MFTDKPGIILFRQNYFVKINMFIMFWIWIITMYHNISRILMFITWINWGLSQYITILSQSTIEIPTMILLSGFWWNPRPQTSLLFCRLARVLTPSGFSMVWNIPDSPRYIEISGFLSLPCSMKQEGSDAIEVRLGSYGRFPIFRWWRAPCSWFHLPKKRVTKKSSTFRRCSIKIYIHVSLD